MDGVVTSRIVANNPLVIMIEKNMSLANIIPTVLLGILLNVII
jgi:hypothetical protein